MVNLFKKEDYLSHSGLKLNWVIDCNSLSDEDLDCLALIGHKLIPPFGYVYGIPTGGDRFARAMYKYISKSSRLLIVDDVCTTGSSLYENYHEGDIGLVIFNRGFALPPWCSSIWNLG